MHKAEFIAVEGGKDLIVSFAIAPGAHKSLTLLRTPKFEVLLPEEERGVSVRFGASGYERELLRRVRWTVNSIEIETSRDHYTVELSSVDPSDIKQAKAMLKRMAKGTSTFIEEL